MKVLHDHGVYVHPFWAFRKECNEAWGFKIQDSSRTPDSDVPYELKGALAAMSGAVSAHISKANTFPKEAQELARVVNTCTGDGLRALRLISMRSHPAFQDNPGIYIRSYPRQGKEESLLQFHAIFLDFLRIQGYITNAVNSFSDTATQDIFIASCKFAIYLA